MGIRDTELGEWAMPRTGGSRGRPLDPSPHPRACVLPPQRPPWWSWGRTREILTSWPRPWTSGLGTLPSRTSSSLTSGVPLGMPRLAATRSSENSSPRSLGVATCGGGPGLQTPASGLGQAERLAGGEGGPPGRWGEERTSPDIPYHRSRYHPPRHLPQQAGVRHRRGRGTGHVGPTACSHPPPNTFHPRLPEGPSGLPGAPGCVLGEVTTSCSFLTRNNTPPSPGNAIDPPRGGPEPACPSEGAQPPWPWVAVGSGGQGWAFVSGFAVWDIKLCAHSPRI